MGNFFQLYSVVDYLCISLLPIKKHLGCCTSVSRILKVRNEEYFKCQHTVTRKFSSLISGLGPVYTVSMIRGFLRETTCGFFNGLLSACRLTSENLKGSCWNN